MALGSQHAHTSTSHPKVSNDPVNHSSLPSMQLCLVAYAMLGTCCPPSSTVGCLGSSTSFSDLLSTSPSLATSGVLNVIRSFSSLAKQEEQQVETDLMRLVKHLTLRNRGLKGLIEVSSRFTRAHIFKSPHLYWFQTGNRAATHRSWLSAD